MSFSIEKEVPKREERISATETFGGTLTDLVQARQNGCLQNKSRSFAQTFNCQMGLALSMINSLPGIAVIMHGSVGCGNLTHLDKNYLTGNRARGVNVKQLVWGSTHLDELDVISGGEEKLRQTIKKMDALHRPSAIIVMTTCSTGIIGDDVDSVVEDMRTKVSAPI
ncbi:MAG: nitrogenase, partial [Peptococcaceae bacterium]|nr:nitrogenase [Peptococcaceae bacterium]